MKKKGFTLVELLAVIAILAILVIIALPNIMGIFNNAKKSSFLTEAKRIYRGAEQAYVKDAFSSSGSKIYAKCKNGCSNELDMDVRDDLEYYIEINSSGKIVKYYIKDNSYQFKYDGEMTINDIKDAQDIGILSESEILVIDNSVSYRYVYAFPFPSIVCREGEVLPSNVVQYNSYEEVVNASGHNVFLRYSIDSDNIVRESYGGFIKNGNVYYIRGGYANLYDENKVLLKNIFGYDCREDANNYTTLKSYGCSISRLRVGMTNTGDTGVGDSNSYCSIYSNKSSMCY